jgi:hypothetical protein
MESQKEDIDLISILRNIKNGVINLFNWVYTTSVNKFLILLVFISLGVGLGFLTFNIKKPIYLSDLTISHIRFDNDQCYELVNNLTKLKGKEAQLAKILKTDVKIMQEVRSITFQPINPRVSKIFNDSVMVMQPFKILAEVYDPSVFDTLESSIMNYLETNEYGVRRKLIKKDYLEKFEEKIKKEILSIDTLKRIVYQSIAQKNTGNGIIIDEPIDPVKISQKAMELYNTQLKTNEDLILNNSFELIVGFNGGVPKTANMPLSMFYGFLVGYLVGLLWLFRRQKKA